MRQEVCPQCGWTVVTVEDFQRHLAQIGNNEEHIQALWSLLGIDHAAMRAEDRARAVDLARERGWELL